jgi:hypothetical protein
VSDASRADAVIKYVEDACFEDSDFAPQFTQGRWSDPDALAASIAAGEFVKTYDQQKIQSVIDDYNVHQHCIFDWIIRCAPAAEDNSRMAPEKGRYISSETEYLPPGDQSPHFEREYFSVISPQKQSSQDYVSPEGIIGRRLPDWSPDRTGFTQLRLFELGRFFLLVATVTTKSHNNGAIDDGADEYKTIVFRKDDLSVVLKHDGRLIEFPRKTLGALVDAYEGCLSAYGNELVFYDGNSFTERAKINLPHGDILTIEPQAPPASETASLIVKGQVVDETRSDESGCDGFPMAKLFEYRYFIDCRDSHAQSCKVTKKQVRSYRGCSDIGGCD